MKIIYQNSLKPLENIPWDGCSAFAYNEKGEFCIVWGDCKDCWSLPGGGREVGESEIECLKREIQEEVQAEAENIEYLYSVFGYGEGKEAQHHRYLCKLTNMQNFIPNKDGFEISEIKFVSLKDLPNYITWLNEENGKEQ